MIKDTHMPEANKSELEQGQIGRVRRVEGRVLGTRGGLRFQTPSVSQQSNLSGEWEECKVQQSNTAVRWQSGTSINALQTSMVDALNLHCKIQQGYIGCMAGAV